jgi:hypothetical protein
MFVERGVFHEGVSGSNKSNSVALKKFSQWN